MLVRYRIRKVEITSPIDRKLTPIGFIRNIKAAIIKPTATALIPDKEFFILVIFFRSLQKGTKNNTRIAPGKLIPRVATMLPTTCPPIPLPEFFIAIAPKNDENEKVGPGTIC